jgi:hypothetical protein
MQQIFRPLDFVWSLSQAKSLKGSAQIDHDTLGRLQ